MKIVKVTIKCEFETDEIDNEAIKEALASQLEELIENDELMDHVKMTVTEVDGDDDDEPEFEDED